MKVNEPLKSIFYHPHYAYMLKEANLKTDRAQFLKLYLLKRIILLQKQDFRIFQKLKQMSQ